jgi:hypothetical protein
MSHPQAIDRDRDSDSQRITCRFLGIKAGVHGQIADSGLIHFGFAQQKLIRHGKDTVQRTESPTDRARVGERDHDLDLLWETTLMSATLTDHEVLSHYRSYDVPPDKFDPRTVSERLLLQHGLPRRPDPKSHPHASAMWERAFSRPIKGIKAQLEVDRVMSGRRRPLLHKGATKDDFQPSGWGGVVMEDSALGFNPAEPIIFASGEWLIPTITPVPNEPAQSLTVGFWLGIDGFGNNQVLQAGMAATITGNNINYWVWTEWYPIGAVQVTNFAIKPGDELSVLVCATQSGQGYVALNNTTTGVATSVNIAPPAGVTSQGATVEWIVEGISADLPDFSPITFTNISAGTKDHSFNLGSASDVITNIGGAAGNLTATTVNSPTSATVKWLKFT